MTTMTTRHLLMLCALVTLTTQGASTSRAHELAAERQLIVQLGASHASVLVTLEERDKARADLIFARYDLNRDGKLEGPEAELAGQLVLPMALQGITLEVIGERPGAQEPKLKFKRTTKGELAMMALVTYTLPPLAPQKKRTFRVSMRDDREYPGLLVRFDALEPMHTLGVKSQDGLISPNTPIALAKGQHTEAIFALIDKNSTK